MDGSDGPVDSRSRLVLESAERGAPAGAGTEGRDHLGQRGDGLGAEQGNDGVGGELGWSHVAPLRI